jgi:hypothetical protein
MKRKPFVHRLTIRFNPRETLALYHALDCRYGKATSRERGRFVRMAIWAYSSAVAQCGEGYHPGMLACDLRKETPAELAYRIGEPEQGQLPLADNIIQGPWGGSAIGAPSPGRAA